MVYKITLPFPISVNSAYNGGSGQQRFKSKALKAWLAKCPKLDIKAREPVTIEYVFYFPDKRLRDGGNYTKVVLDYLVNQGVLSDDNYTIVEAEHWTHNGIDKLNPRVEIFIKEQVK